MAQAFPNLTGQQIVDILFRSADELGAAGTDAIFGRGRLNIQRAFQPIGTHDASPGPQTAVTDVERRRRRSLAAAGDGGQTGAKFGTIILDGYSRAFALDLAKSLEAAEQRRPLEQALTGRSPHQWRHRRAGRAVADHRRAPSSAPFVDLTQLAIGPDDARQSRLVAGNAIARLDRKTRLAFGIAEGAKSLERDLSGAAAGASWSRATPAATPASPPSADRASRCGASSGARVGLTLSAENGEVVPRPPRRPARHALSPRDCVVRQAPRQPPGCRSA